MELNMRTTLISLDTKIKFIVKNSEQNSEERQKEKKKNLNFLLTGDKVFTRIPSLKQKIPGALDDIKIPGIPNMEGKIC